MIGPEQVKGSYVKIRMYEGEHTVLLYSSSLLL